MNEFKWDAFLGGLFLLALGGALIYWGGLPKQSGASRVVGFFTDFFDTSNPLASKEPWRLQANWQTIAGFVGGVGGLALIVYALVQAGRGKRQQPYWGA